MLKLVMNVNGLNMLLSLIKEKTTGTLKHISHSQL